MARVLVIEDEPFLRRRIASILLANGYEVDEAENGKEGIELLQKDGIPSVILLDMVMPALNGWGFLDFQRNHGIYAQIPVIIISAYEDLAKSARPSGFLPKPVESDALLKVVAQFAN